MDKLRANVAGLAGLAARSRPLVSLRSLLAGPGRDRHASERGQGLAEYSLILAGIAIVAIASLVFLGETITTMFWNPIDAEFGRVLCDIIGICP